MKKFLLAALFLCKTSVALATPLMLFGTPLLGATRSTLEPALSKVGLTPIQTGSKWWYDIYHVNGQLPGANKLLVGYTQVSGRYAAFFSLDSS
jgi:hypothetical protein